MTYRFYQEGKRTVFTVTKTSAGWQMKYDGAAMKVNRNRWYVYFNALEVAADWIGCYLNGLATWDEALGWKQVPDTGTFDVLGITYRIQ